MAFVGGNCNQTIQIYPCGETCITSFGVTRCIQIPGVLFFFRLRSCVGAAAHLLHVRRRFYEIQSACPASIAAEALVRIGALYAIQADIRGCSVEQRQRMRFSRSKPFIDALKP